MVYCINQENPRRSSRKSDPPEFDQELKSREPRYLFLRSEALPRGHVYLHIDTHGAFGHMLHVHRHRKAKGQAEIFDKRRRFVGLLSKWQEVLEIEVAFKSAWQDFLAPVVTTQLDTFFESQRSKAQRVAAAHNIGEKA